MHNPDIPPLVWEDVRLTSPYRLKKNKEQILAAAGNIFDFFCLKTQPGKPDAIKKKLLGDLDAAIGSDVEADSSLLKKSRLANYKNLLGGNYKKYDKEQWFDASVDRQVEANTIGTSDVKYNHFWKSDYLKSDWYGFQEAVKAHQAVAFKVFGKTFEEMEVDVA